MDASTQQHQQPSFNVDKFIADIPALNDHLKILPTPRSNESISQSARLGSFDVYDSLVSNSPLVTPNAFKDRMWDPMTSEFNLNAASNDLSTSFANLLKSDSTFAMFEENLDANAVLEQNVKDVAKLWQCPAF